MHWEPLSDLDQQIIARQLQRPPRNLYGVARRCSRNCPLVIVNHPLPQTGQDAYFFPTIFWLTCPKIVQTISRLEDQGFIRQIQTKLAEFQQVRQSLQDAHHEYVFIRRRLLGLEKVIELKARSQTLTRDLEERGIGGSADFRAVKCLHMHYAHYLVTRNNPIGFLVSKSLEFSGSQAGECQGCA